MRGSQSFSRLKSALQGVGMRVLLLLLLAAASPAAEIHRAAENGNLDTVKSLVVVDTTRVNERDREGKTPLHFAAAKGHVDVVKFLLENGAEVNARSSSGITPMYLAKGFGKAEAANLLARHGGSTEVVRPDKAASKPAPPVTPPIPPPKPAAKPPPLQPLLHPIFDAVKSNDLAAIGAILRSEPVAVQVRDANRWTALHHAAERGHVEAAAALLQAGADAAAVADKAVTALHIAAQCRSPEMVAALLAARANPNARTAIEAAPLMQAAATGDNLGIVKLLLEAGAEVNARDQYGNSALILAARVEKPDGVAEVLLAAGADASAKEQLSGFTALHHAVLRGNRPLVEALLANGADCNAAILEGETPLSLALYESRAEIAEVLKRHGARLPPEKPLNDLERNLVAHYRQRHALLAACDFDQLRKLLLEAAPTREEVKKVFLQGAEAAWDLLERIRRDETMAWGAANRSEADRQNYLSMIKNHARAGEYLRLEPLPPSPLVRAAQARRLIANEVPVLQLQVKRRGGLTTVEGDFFRVGDRWVIMPALNKVFPELKAQ